MITVCIHLLSELARPAPIFSYYNSLPRIGETIRIAEGCQQYVIKDILHTGSATTVDLYVEERENLL